MFGSSDSDHPIDQIRAGLMSAIGGDPQADTIKLIDEQKSVVERELVQVPQRAEARGAEFMGKAKESLEEVVAALKNFGQWLDSAKDGLTTEDMSAVVSAYEGSHDIIPELSAAVEKYGAVYAAFGPYHTIPANGLSRLAEGIVSGEVQAPAWKEMTDYYSSGLVQKVIAIKVLTLPGKSSLVEGYEACSAGMTQLGAIDPTAPEEYGPVLQALDARLHATESLERLMSQSVESPTAIPSTNVLLAGIRAYQDKDLAKGTLESIVDDYGEIMDSFSETFEQNVSKPIDSVLAQEEIPRTLDIVDSHYAAVEEVIAALESDNEAALAECVQKLTDTAQKLDDTRNVYATALQHEQQVLCPSCSRANPPENRLCEACGETLPRSAEASAQASSTFSVMASQQVLEENQPMVMTENVARLFQACDDVAVGNITDEEFLKEVRNAKVGVKDFTAELDDVAESFMDKSSFTDEQWEVWESQHLPHIEDVAQGYLHGIAETNEGLDVMESYLENRNDNALVNGIRQVWEGLGVIHRSTLSMQTYSKLLDDVLSEAAADGLISTEG